MEWQTLRQLVDLTQMRALDAYYTKTDRAVDRLLAWFDELYRRAKAELADLSGPIALTRPI
jgi:hypothetical protein